MKSLHFHQDKLAERNQDSGAMGPENAESGARCEFGNPTRTRGDPSEVFM